MMLCTGRLNSACAISEQLSGRRNSECNDPVHSGYTVRRTKLRGQSHICGCGWLWVAVVCYGFPVTFYEQLRPPSTVF